MAGYSENGSGNFLFAVARYTTAGVLDTTFNPTGSLPGTVTTATGTGGDDSAYAIDIDSNNGKIVVAGYSEDGSGNDLFAVARYLP